MSIALPLLDTQPVRPDFALGPRSLAAVRLLRLSVTDRCNLRCIYCMPDTGVAFERRDDLLTDADILAVARAAAGVGVNHFKITGGEPTVRDDLLDIVAGLANLETRQPLDLSMTTNGLLLERLARPLRDAGLQRLTVSWDSLRPERFDRITGGRFGRAALGQLQRGLDTAVAAGFERLKINVVVMAGVNDDEVADFAALTLDRPWTVRFIEYMPLGQSRLTGAHERDYTFDNALVRQRIEQALGPMSPVDRDSEAGVGPAQVFQLTGALGRVGFISAMSKPFCQTCNRLRLTAVGELRSCLFDGGEVDIWPALRPKLDLRRLVEMMRRCVALKPDVHSDHGNRAMSQIGG